ncbi:hypothetical protein [Roseateles sp. L2-2]|uniref:hypothetical protein n=1 Tax=Roseateles sp. L2-2 TaxID=3422597 RepID=UPI003D36444A
MFGFFKKKVQAGPLTERQIVAVEPPQPSFLKKVWQRVDSASPLSDDLLRARLAEAVAWCDALQSLDDLRAGTLRPSRFHDGPEDVDVCELGHNRQRQLHDRKLPVDYQSPVVTTGRFMLYFPDENLSDGYAEIVSRGFFDVDNLPAYDTWVSLVPEDGSPRMSGRRCLLCYVPASMIELADAGIEGNPESCIEWLDRLNLPVRPRVQALTCPTSRRWILR